MELKGSKEDVHILQVCQSGIRQNYLQTANYKELYAMKVFVCCSLSTLEKKSKSSTFSETL